MVVENPTKLDGCGGVTQQCNWLTSEGAGAPCSIVSASTVRGWNDAHVAAFLFNVECNDSYVAAFLHNLAVRGQA